MILEVKDISAVCVKPFLPVKCQHVVSFENSRCEPLLQSLRNGIFTQMKWDTWHERACNLVIFHRLSNTQDGEAISEQEFLWFRSIMFCLCTAAVSLRVPLETPLLLTWAATCCREPTLDVTVQMNALCNAVWHEPFTSSRSKTKRGVFALRVPSAAPTPHGTLWHCG